MTREELEAAAIRLIESYKNQQELYPTGMEVYLWEVIDMHYQKEEEEDEYKTAVIALYKYVIEGIRP